MDLTNTPNDARRSAKASHNIIDLPLDEVRENQRRESDESVLGSN